MEKRIFSFIFCIILIFSVFSVSASAYQLSGFEVSAEGALIASLDTGDVLYKKNTDKRLYPASLTKIMTAVLVLENTDNLDSEIITVSYDAIHDLDGTGSSMGGLIEGEQITARQALYFLLMKSANEGSNAVAEHYGGSISGFVGMMNEKAKELGMNGTHYANAHGLHDKEHYTTVADMYTLIKHALSFPEFKEITSTTRYTVPATNKSGERLLATTVFLQDRHNAASPSYYYPYAAGIKTGYTDEAGRCLISTASKGGYNYVCILMNSTVRNANGALVRYEFGDSKALYEWAFNNFEYKTVVDENAPVAEAKVNLCWDQDYVPLLLEGGLSAILPKDADSSTVQIKTEPYKKSFDAPIKKGEVLGTAEISYAGEVLGTVNLVAGETLKANFILKAMRSIKRAFTSSTFKIIVVLVILAIIAFILTIVFMNRKRRSRRGRYRPYKKRK